MLVDGIFGEESLKDPDTTYKHAQQHHALDIFALPSIANMHEDRNIMPFHAVAASLRARSSIMSNILSHLPSSLVYHLPLEFSRRFAVEVHSLLSPHIHISSNI